MKNQRIIDIVWIILFGFTNILLVFTPIVFFDDCHFELGVPISIYFKYFAIMFILLAVYNYLVIFISLNFFKSNKLRHNDKYNPKEKLRLNVLYDMN